MAERTVFQSLSQRHVVSLGPQASVWEAACVMTRANCGSVLILDSAGVLLGIRRLGNCPHRQRGGLASVGNCR